MASHASTTSEDESSFSKTKKIGIIGSGLIGRSWAMIFVSRGYDVYIYDVSDALIDTALKAIHESIDEYAKKRILRGHFTATMQKSRIYKATSLMDCVSNAYYVQECVPENIELKIKVFKDIDAVLGPRTIVASSTSCFLPSTFTADLVHKSHMMVAHPINPPYFVPLVELIPAPWTTPEVVVKARELHTSVGQKPVTVKKEVPGFIVNRIQYAILNEAYRLIADNVISVEDVDTVMSDGLGMRYAFMGPWETGHLNAPGGMPDYFERYAKGIFDVSSTSGPPPMMEGATAKLISDQMLAKIPVSQLAARQKWRDEKLIALSKIKKEPLL